MSKYTTEVRFICESKSGLSESKGCDNVDEIITSSWDKIFTTKCTFFDETYRSVLCKKILKHYYLREIGAETVGVWKLWMNTRLEEIMPYYNQLYKSELLEFNPFYDVDLTRKHNRTGEEVSKNTGTSTETSTNNKDTTGSGETNKTGSGTSTNTRNTTDNVTSENTRTLTGSTTNSGETTDTRTGNGSKNQTTSATDNKTDKYSDTPQGSISDLSNDTYLTNARIIGDSTSGSLTESTSESSNGTTKTTDNGSENSTTKDGGSSEETGTIKDNGTTSDTEHDTNSYTENVAGTGTRNGNTTSDGSVNSTEDYLETVIGKQGTESYSSLLSKYRDTFLNIDMQVIGEFSDLFFGLW